jgi:hypothetical protein
MSKRKTNTNYDKVTSGSATLSKYFSNQKERIHLTTGILPFSVTVTTVLLTTEYNSYFNKFVLL